MMKSQILGMFAGLIMICGVAKAQDYFPMQIGYSWIYNIYDDSGTYIGIDSCTFKNTTISNDTVFYHYHGYVDSISGGNSTYNEIYYNNLQDSNSVITISDIGDVSLFKHNFIPFNDNTPYESGGNLIFPKYLGDYVVEMDTFHNSYWLKLNGLDSTGFIVTPNVGLITSISEGIITKDLKRTTFVYNTDINPPECIDEDLIGANWLTPATGFLDCNYFEIRNINDPTNEISDFQGIDFSETPLSENQASISYQGASHWSIKFNNPIERLRLYARWWRQYKYTFNHEPTLLSGSGLMINGDTLIVNDTWGNGIIEFPNPITELSISTDQPCCSYQILTFGIAPTCANSVNTIDTAVCDSYISPSGSHTWTISDTYIDTIPNSTGCDSIITINLTIDCSTAIENNFGNSFSVYPNPTRKDVVIDLGQDYSDITIKIMNMTSQVRSTNYFKSANRVSFELEGEKGLYLIAISTKNGKRAIMKIVKN